MLHRLLLQCLRVYRVSYEKKSGYSAATIYWDEASRLEEKSQTFKQPLLQICVKMTSFKSGPAKEKHIPFKTWATT